MELSVIVEREQDVPKSKPNELDLENSADSGLASTSGNSLDTGKNDVIKKPIIIEFKALNPKDKVPKESTFLTKVNEAGNNCDISIINGDDKGRGTLNSDGKI